MSKTLCVGATSAALACTPVAQIRSEPPPEPCPPGAIEAMEEFGIRPYPYLVGTGTVFWEVKSIQITTVTEGMVKVRHARGLGTLPQWTALFGRLIFGERVYGRLTRARSPDGKIDIPVCLEIVDAGGERGLIDRGERGTTTATVLSDFLLAPVREFK